MRLEDVPGDSFGDGFGCRNEVPTSAMARLLLRRVLYVRQRLASPAVNTLQLHRVTDPQLHASS